MSNHDAEAQRAWIKKVLGVDVASEPKGETPVSLADARKRWGQAVGLVSFTLDELEAAIAQSGDPLAGQAIVMIKSVAVQLRKMPETAKQLTEVTRYLDTDPIIDDLEEPNRFDIEVRIRRPFVAALAVLQPLLPA